MNRMEFMRELEALLSDIPESERSEALQYYEDYLNDAGVENEQGAMEELGTPEEIANHIKAGLNGNEEGAFTENGYEQEAKKKNPPAKQEHFSDTGAQTEKSGESGGYGRNLLKTLLIVLLLILFSPFILSVVLAIFGLLIGAAAAVFGVWIGAFATGAALLTAGFLCLIVGLVKLFTVPLAGALVTGLGLLMLGIGMLLTIVVLWAAWKLVPPVMRGLVSLIQKPFRRNSGKNVSKEENREVTA